MTDDRIVRMLRVSESDPVQQEAADEIERLIAELATEKEVSASRQKLIFAGLAERDAARAERDEQKRRADYLSKDFDRDIKMYQA